MEWIEVIKLYNRNIKRSHSFLLNVLVSTKEVQNISTLLKKRHQHECFPVNFVKFFKNTFFTEHLWVTTSVYRIFSNRCTSWDHEVQISYVFFSFKCSEVESVMGYCVIYTMLKTESFFLDVLSGNTLSLIFVRWQGWEVFKILVIKSGMARGKGGAQKQLVFLWHHF